MDEYNRRRRRSRAVMSMFLDSLGGSIDNVDVATFDSDGTDLKALVVGIEPVQSGTGDPSPDNVRPITGHSSVNVIVSPTLNPLDGTITNIPLGQTVYGGTLDVLTGMLTVTHGIYTFSATDGWIKYETGGKVTFNSGNVFPPNIDTTKDGIMSNYPFYKTAYIGGQMNKSFCFFSAPSLSVCDDAYTDASDFRDSMIGQQLVYYLATPQTIQLTGQQIATFLGTNNVWCDSGKIIHLEY